MEKAAIKGVAISFLIMMAFLLMSSCSVSNEPQEIKGEIYQSSTSGVSRGMKN